MTMILGATWELELKLPCGGHRIYKRPLLTLNPVPEYQYAIADDSGRWPHTTEDGVLFLDFLKPIEIVGEGRMVAMIPLTDDKGLEVQTVDSIAGGLLLAAHFDWPIVYRNYEFKVIKVRE